MDTNRILMINPANRKIEVPEKERLIGVYQDHDSERKYFKCPRIVGDNVDLSQHRIYVNYVPSKINGTFNEEEEVGSYLCEDVVADGDYVTFSWKISENVTREAGYIAFSVYAKKADADGKLKTKWHTTPAIGNVLDTLPDGDQIVSRYPDIIEQIMERLDRIGEIDPEQIAGAVEEYMTAHPFEETDPTVPDWAKQPEKPTYTAEEVGADASGTAESKVSTHNTDADAHNDIRLLVEGLKNRLNALADSDDTTLDQMSEVVGYIKSNKALIDAITTSKVSVSDIIDNLITNVSDKPLSAAQGVALKRLIDAITTVELDETLTDNTKAAPAGMVGELKSDLDYLDDSIKNETYLQRVVTAKAEYISGSYKMFLDISGYNSPCEISVYAPSIDDGTVSTYYCDGEKKPSAATSAFFENHIGKFSLKNNFPYLRLSANGCDDECFVVEETIGVLKWIVDANSKIEEISDSLQTVKSDRYIGYVSEKADSLSRAFVPTSLSSDYDESGLICGKDVVVKYPISYANSSVKIGSRNSDKSALGEYTLQLDENAIGSFRVNESAYYYAFFIKQGERIGVYFYDTIKNRMDSLELRMNTFDKCNLSISGTSVVADNGDVYRNCMFVGCAVTPANNVKFYDCDFVNTILLSENPVSSMHVCNNRFIGNNARIQIAEIADCLIDGNDFMVSDDENYPDATPKTKGEFSRNIFVRSMNRCKITNNYIRIGRTGICCLGDNSRMTKDNVQNLSSCDNVISNNYIGGIGEEHISFDGGTYFDVCRIDSVSVTLKDVNTNQMINGQDESSNQIKKVASVTMHVSTELVGTHGYSDTKHIKNFQNLTKGIYAVNTKNSKYYAITGIYILNTAVDTDGVEYSADGTYSITVDIPTIYSNLNPIDSTNEQNLISEIKNEWANGDILSLTSVQARNIISNNTIEGIGTDTISNVSDMGGIVLYGTCINNVVSNNILHQKRIWMINWDNKSGPYESKMKMQSFNTISGNMLYNTAISLVTLNGVDGFAGKKLSRGNTLSSNTIIGTDAAAGVMIDNFVDTKLIGNTSRHYRIRNCDGMKLIGNTAETYDGSGSYFYDNTNVVSDSTDEIQAGFGSIN